MVSVNNIYCRQIARFHFVCPTHRGCLIWVKFVNIPNHKFESQLTVINRHVILPGTPEHGTPEHQNSTEHSGTPPKTPEQPKKTRNTSQKTRNTSQKTRNTFFLPASLSSLAGTNSKYKQNKVLFYLSFEALKCKIFINIRNSVLFQPLVSAISTLLLTEPIQWMLEPLHHRCSALYLLSWEAN